MGKSTGHGSPCWEGSTVLHTHSHTHPHTLSYLYTHVSACTHTPPHPRAVVIVNPTSMSQVCGVGVLKQGWSPFCIPNTVTGTSHVGACGPQNASQTSKCANVEPQTGSALREICGRSVAEPHPHLTVLSGLGGVTQTGRVWDLGPLTGVLLNVETVACPLPVWLPPASSSAQSSRRDTEDRHSLI